MKKGLTLLELIITVAMFSILVVVVFSIFRTVLLSWSSQETRAGIDIVIHRATEEMTRELRGAKDIDFVNPNEIRFTTPNDNYYIYYLYNENDSYPPGPMYEDSYELRKAELQNVKQGDLATGTFTYGTGKIILTDVLPPPTTDLAISGDIVTIDISMSRGTETIRAKTKVMPRNLE